MPQGENDDAADAVPDAEAGLVQTSSYLDMLNDSPRNQAYAQVCVLDC